MGKPLVIHVLANDGSPLGVTEQSIYGHDGRMGVGGAELGIMTLMSGWVKAGHEVTFYNNPPQGYQSSFKQAPISLFQPHEYRDILIVFRSPNRRILHAGGKKIWFSTDQYTVGDFSEFAGKVDEIVTISPFHADYFKNQYRITNTHVIDLPVRTWEYDRPDLQKTRHSLIFCSVATRGLEVLAKCYDRLHQAIPDLTLTVTSDFRLWGSHSPLNEQYMRMFMGKPGVRFMGAISRHALIEQQLQAEVHAYPCTYDELFCYASAECQVAGCYPISSGVGALSTTNMGQVIQGRPEEHEWQERFIRDIVTTMNERERTEILRQDIQSKAKKRFSLETILCQWDKVLYG